MNRNELTIEVLRTARDDVLRDESRWVKARYTTDDQEGGCSLGAIWIAASTIKNAEPYQCDAISALDAEARLLGFTDVVGFNDHEDTTYEDVISLFDKVIKRLEEQS